MIDKLKNTKDNVVGKMKETTGKMINSDKLELNGKLQSFQSKIGEGMEKIKGEMAEKANQVIEQTKPDQNNNHN